MQAQTRQQPEEPRLNLGCGDDYRDGYVNVDVSAAVDPDIQHDLDEYPWPWPDDAFEYVEARHVLEHLERPLRAFDELARIVKRGGGVLWVYPIGHTRFEDVTHDHFWTVNTAEQICGERKHDHETGLPFRTERREINWNIGHAEPLVELYTRYRLWLRGPGPWLSQIPGCYGGVEVLLKRE